MYPTYYSRQFAPLKIYYSTPSTQPNTVTSHYTTHLTTTLALYYQPHHNTIPPHSLSRSQHHSSPPSPNYPPPHFTTYTHHTTSHNITPPHLPPSDPRPAGVCGSGRRPARPGRWLLQMGTPLLLALQDCLLQQTSWVLQSESCAIYIEYCKAVNINPNINPKWVTRETLAITMFVRLTGGHDERYRVKPYLDHMLFTEIYFHCI